jgi:RecB family exonuclease
MGADRHSDRPNHVKSQFCKIEPMKVILSYSKIQTFLECPLKYKYQYIDKIPIIPSVHMVFGSALHEGIAEFATRRKSNHPVTHQDLMNTFLETWNKQYTTGLLNSIEEQEQWIQKGKQFLQSFFRREGFVDIHPQLIEKKFYLPIDELTVLNGIFDRVDRETKNHVVIMEFKTNLKYERSDLQLKLYAYAYRQLYHWTPSKSFFVSIETGEKLEYDVNNKDLDQVKPFLISIGNKIRAAEFPANPSTSNCRFCLARTFCSFKK